ncbi:MAG TPA: hypothetical protein VKS22_14760 [Candidatus Binataceae bacterium]|nr:hypothetical protein [Candidatus Binataceae bacterium]
MGAIVKFSRPVRIRKAAVTSAAVAARESAARDIAAEREEAASIKILLWTFALAALAMCVTVVVTLARSWDELLWISAFVLVFAILKIALANALFYVMINYDKDRREIPLKPADAHKPPPRAIRATRHLTATLTLAASRKSSPTRQPDRSH